MATLLEKVTAAFSRDTGTDECRAIVTDDGDLCSNKMWGHGFVNGYEVKYCREHAPSEVTPGLLRTDPIEFYIQDEDVEITVK